MAVSLIKVRGTDDSPTTEGEADEVADAAGLAPIITMAGHRNRSLPMEL